MVKIHGNQKGGAVMTLIVLAIAAYGVYVGLQYVPLHIESTSVDSILASLQGGQKAKPLTSVHEIEAKIKNLLYINEMRDMEEYFKVRNYRQSFTIEVSYTRELNLLFDTKVLNFKKSLTLE